MRRAVLFGAALAALFWLAGCDAVRYPGDGGEAPRTPPPTRDAGQPGPPPPTSPVSDPYGDGEDAGEQPPASMDPPSDGESADNGATPPPLPPPSDPGPGAGEDAVPDDIPDNGPPENGEPDPADGAQGDGENDGENGDGGGEGQDGGPAPGDEVAAGPAAFSYFPPGQLLPGSGTGAFDQIVHAPDMVFPIRSAPAYLQSQVWNFGGGVAGGDQCDSRNFAYPWRDNFCETRSADRGTPFCPLNRVHQGQDIRVGTPEDCRQLRAADATGRTLHEVVAVEDGLIYDIGTYTVKLRSGGRISRYLPLNMAELQVEEGDTVEAGDIIGYVSNDFGGTPTTFHLHFEIIQNTEAYGWEHVPPYLSLVEAYERREAGRGERLRVDAATASARILPVPEGLEIIE